MEELATAEVDLVKLSQLKRSLEENVRKLNEFDEKILDLLEEGVSSRYFTLKASVDTGVNHFTGAPVESFSALNGSIEKGLIFNVLSTANLNSCNQFSGN